MGLVRVAYKTASRIARPLRLEQKIGELAIRVGGRKMAARIPNVPHLIWVEPTNACNLRCIMCDRQAVDRRKVGFMDFELFTKIMDEAADLRVTEVAMGLGGEPLLHPRLTDMIKYASNKGLLVSFNTNANLLFEEKSRAILNSGLDKIVFSVDGASKETYENIRLRGNYDAVTENIEKFLSLKKNLGLEKPKTILQTIIMRDTKDEISAVIDRWYPLVDEVSVTTVTEYGNVRGLSLLLKNPRSPRIPCFLLWYSVSILWNGDVTVCCNDIGGELIIGNIADNSLKELWESDKLNEIRRMFRKGELGGIPKCDKCEAINVDLIRKKKALVARMAGSTRGRKITVAIE